MKIKGRESDAWHKNIDDAVGPRKPTDADFPWTALQNHTGIYLKKKGRLSTTEVDERLLALIEKHTSKEVAIAACAREISACTIRNLLVNDLKVERGCAFRFQEYLQIIVATNHVNPAAVSEIEVQWASCLLEHAAADGSSRSLAQQLHEVLSLLPSRVAPDLLLQDDICRLAVSVCTDFAKQLELLRHRNQWMDAHAAVEWLSTASTGSETLHDVSPRTRTLLGYYLPRWGAWTAWRPHISRLRTWKDYAPRAYAFLGDLLALEGPDFASAEGSERATLREGLIAQSASDSQSMSQWGKFRATFKRNPFREHENLSGILKRLMGLIDYGCSAGSEFTALLVYLCEGAKISNEALQILEGVQILDNPTLTEAVLQTLTVPKQNVRQKIKSIRQLLPVLADSRIWGLRWQVQPHVVDATSDYVKEQQHTLLMHLDAGSQWLDTAMELLVFAQDLREQTWLLADLHLSVRECIDSAPSLITIGTLAVVRNSIRSTKMSAPTPLLSQIDTYCRALLMPGCKVDTHIRGLIEVLISLWQQDLDVNHRELALLIADFPNTSCLFRCDCLRDIMNLRKPWVISTLEALKLQDGNPELGCFSLIRLLASADSSDILERWRNVLLFAIEKQEERLLLHAVTHLTTVKWLELLDSIRKVYKGLEVIIESHSPGLLSLEIHAWSQQMAVYLPEMTRLERVLNHGPAMQMLLLGHPASKHRLLRVLDHVKNKKSNCHGKVMDSIIALLDSKNAEVVEDALTAVSKAGLKGAEACSRVLATVSQVSPKLAEVDLAVFLRAGDFRNQIVSLLEKPLAFSVSSLTLKSIPLQLV